MNQIVGNAKRERSALPTGVAKKIRCSQLVDEAFIFPGRKRYEESRERDVLELSATFEGKVFPRERFHLTRLGRLNASRK